MAKPEAKKRALLLRAQGKGIKIIANTVHVSTSTASLWCREVRLTDDQQQALRTQAIDPLFGRRLSYRMAVMERTKNKIKRLMNQGKSTVAVLTDRELLLVGVALYWAEGFKKDSLVGFANSDPSMIQLFIRWLFVCCGVKKDRLRFRIGINEMFRNRVSEIESYWRLVLKVKPKQFQKPYFQKTVLKKLYKENDYHGVLRVRVSRSIDLLRVIQGQINGLRENV